MLNELLAPYLRIEYPDPPNFSLTSKPAQAAFDHLAQLEEIREHNDRAAHNVARLFYWILFGVGCWVLVSILVAAT